MSAGDCWEVNQQHLNCEVKTNHQLILGGKKYKLIKFITTRIDVYETLCPKQMLVNKSGQINNVQLITGMG